MLFAPLLLAGPDAVTMTLVPSGAVGRMGSLQMMGAKLGAVRTARPARALVAPRYGRMTFGTKTVPFALSEPKGAKPTLVVDTNGDGDLSNDAPVAFDVVQEGSSKVRIAVARIDLGKGQPVSVQMRRYDPADPALTSERATLSYFADYGYELGIRLDGRPFTAFIVGDPRPDTSFGVDRDGDGDATSLRETIEVGKPFNFTGTTYRVVPQAGGLVLKTTTERLPLAPLPPNLAAGRPSLPIRGTALDGSPVDLRKDYRGKIVLLNFWATWCDPCLEEMPHIRAAYAKYRARGFDVLGVSFDEANMAKKLRAFTKARGLPWRQLYDGKGWETKVAADYDVSGIPFMLLIDGDTGRILVADADLDGESLSALIGQKLAERKAGK